VLDQLPFLLRCLQKKTRRAATRGRQFLRTAQHGLMGKKMVGGREKGKGGSRFLRAQSDKKGANTRFPARLKTGKFRDYIRACTAKEWGDRGRNRQLLLEKNYEENKAHL